MLLFHLSMLIFCSPLASAQYDPQDSPGRSVFVHLFEWKWTDIAAECERFLGPKGFGGVQVSPPNEHRLITTPPYPWYERYQPVSWKLTSRSGTEAEFKNMVKRCNNAGVRIYVDAVFNQMAGDRGVGSAGSPYDSNSLSYPGVPFTPSDFTNRSECHTQSGDISNYDDPNEVRNCRLLGMPDVAIYKEHTRKILENYLNRLIDIGVAGFRIDAAKHVWPEHLKGLLTCLKALNSKWFPAGARPFIFQEVIDQGGQTVKSIDYTGNGRVTEFKFGLQLSKGVMKRDGQMLKYYRNFGEEWGLLPTDRAVVFVDNHDNQRGHGGGGDVLTFRSPREYKIANIYMLAHPYGLPKIMSSYLWPQNIQNNEDKNNWIGPPSDKDGRTNDVEIHSDDSCGGGWICEHRWRQITNMVAFRNIAGNSSLVHWWDNGGNQVAFGRGSTGKTTAFVVINNDNQKMQKQLQTGLPSGNYCDVISGSRQGRLCSGKLIRVDADGMAMFSIDNHDEDPVAAIHLDSRI
ncbi:hypothetical protein RvY_15491 [Ramazzottius varieornatus]|uniref:Alpha-amylase n=1 Tax=Ramazzottius varieornatus TaxID=947166 RepID=A0A1D1VYC6_RAMVA|nr:hypothetical protein RvY_15491 [Ramazzottius varieornatus]